MSLSTSSRQRIFAISVIIGCIGFIVAVVLIGYSFFTGRNLVAEILPKRVDFTAYRPSVLPSSLHLTGVTATYASNDDGSGRDPYYAVEYTTSEPSLSIGEEKVVADENPLGSCKDGKPQMTNETCQTYTTPKGQTYTISRSMDNDGKVFNGTLTIYKGTTRIYINFFNSTSSLAYIDADWSASVDSLAVDTGKIPVQVTHFTGAG